MNIGPIVRGLLGENRAGQPKELELKMGQVIRGVVLSVSDNGQEAVVQVQGVQLRAVLETPLQKGQTTLLQVQPPGKDGMAVLKPLNLTSAGALTDRSLSEMLDSFGMENTPENRELLKLMQTQGMPLTKDAAAALQQSMASMPKGLPLEQWVESAAIAFHRGLPITAASVAGLNQAVFGPSVQNLLSALGDQVAALLAEISDLENIRPDSGKQGNPSAGMSAPSSDTEGSANPDGAGRSGSGSNGLTGQSAAAVPSKGSDLLLKIQVLLDELRSLGSQGAASSTAGNSAGLDNYGTITEEGSNINRTLNGNGSQREAAASGAAGSATAGPGAQGAAGAGGQGSAGAAVAGAGGQGPAGAAVAGAGGQGPAAAAVAGAGAQGAAGAAVTGANVQGAAGAAVIGAGAHGAAGAAGTGAGGQGAGAAASAPEEPGAAPAAAAPARTHAAEPWVARVLKLLGAEHEQQTARTVTLGASPAQPEAPPATAARAASAAAGGAAAPGGEVPAGSVPQAAPGEQAAPARSGAAAAVPGAAVPAGQPERHAAAGGPAALPEVPAAAAEPAAAVRETLKSVLMQVLESSDLPPQLQDTAKQLVNQLTGQQLLMNTDRTAPFAQMTMYLPFTGPDGDQTASVHIQSRRGRRGELDASNCRLWFDLNMKHLGQVMVDVQVADKKVILKIHSEQEAVGTFIESRQEEIHGAIESAGYRLLSLKAEPIDASSDRPGADSVPSLYVPPAYKGVDFRI
ncbi:flagellar hook-length control protein FliK [Paenibacillus sp. YPG26]|uniref:flagellar hook-length control protein FliK n=1 Tax=Paenibacillus sp. YPG26 TaxID=2878915 RepID=UPI00203FA628|nr:flagellar hook-length control protein FliK [Paenibacillus sp. YPG26]USB32114.1 flagellar hook-length control protein FliK [Paenibacillus sp. YPG26]